MATACRVAFGWQPGSASMHHDVGQSISTRCSAPGPGRRECLARSSGAPTGRNREQAQGFWEELSVSLADRSSARLSSLPAGRFCVCASPGLRCRCNPVFAWPQDNSPATLTGQSCQPFNRPLMGGIAHGSTSSNRHVPPRVVLPVATPTAAGAAGPLRRDAAALEVSAGLGAGMALQRAQLAGQTVLRREQRTPAFRVVPGRVGC